MDGVADMQRLFSLAGQVALVTGASGGLGQYFAAVLAAAGATVVLTGRRREKLDEAAADLSSAGGRAIAVLLDVTVSASVRDAFDEAERLVGPVTLLVNNSGLAATAPAIELAEEDFDRVMATNLRGPWLVSREMARRARSASLPGSIINVASILGVRVAGNVSAYAASKAGLIQLTRAMAFELARDHIRVNALLPGYIETDLNRAFFASEAGAAMIKRIPQRRLGMPSDLDGPLLLLASDASRFMTGETLVVDGGHLSSSL